MKKEAYIITTSGGEYVLMHGNFGGFIIYSSEEQAKAYIRVWKKDNPALGYEKISLVLDK